MMSPGEFTTLVELLERTPMTAGERLFIEGLMRRFASAVQQAMEDLKKEQEAQQQPESNN